MEVGSSDDDEEDQICGAVVSVRAKADRIRESRPSSSQRTFRRFDQWLLSVR